MSYQFHLGPNSIMIPNCVVAILGVLWHGFVIVNGIDQG